jgi:hypothetical protein
MSVPVVMGAAEQILTQHARQGVESLSHLMFDCPATSVQRDTMFDEIRSALQDVAGGAEKLRNVIIIMLPNQAIASTPSQCVVIA